MNYPENRPLNSILIVIHDKGNFGLELCTGYKRSRKRRASCNSLISRLITSHPSRKWKPIYHFPYLSFAGFLSLTWLFRLGEWNGMLTVETSNMFAISASLSFYLFIYWHRLIWRDMLQELYHKAEKLLSASLNDWGLTLAASDNLDPVWARLFSDPFIRRLLLRLCVLL